MLSSLAYFRSQRPQAQATCFFRGLYQIFRDLANDLPCFAPLGPCKVFSLVKSDMFLRPTTTNLWELAVSRALYRFCPKIFKVVGGRSHQRRNHKLVGTSCSEGFYRFCPKIFKVVGGRSHQRRNHKIPNGYKSKSVSDRGSARGRAHRVSCKSHHTLNIRVACRRLPRSTKSLQTR